MTAPTKIAGAKAGERLRKALIDLAAAGLRPPCADPELSHLWLSDHPDERAVAAVLCGGCPAELQCWDTARARVDRTRHPNNKGGKLGRPPKIDSPP
jgi:hypothetical protein